MTKLTKMVKLTIIVVIFLLGMYFCSTVTHKDFVENFIDEDQPCADLLIKKDSKIFLYNSKVAYVPGVNPVVFNNLEEYVEYVDWQKSQGLYCDVLYLEHGFDAQNNSKYDLKPNPDDPQGGLSVHNALHSKDDISSKILSFNEIAEDLDHSYKTKTKSANAMNTNWGGPKFARKLVADGHFTNHESDERFGELYMNDHDEEDPRDN